MAINFDSFTEGTTSTIQSNDYLVGFDTAVPDGERKYLVSTIANAVSGIMSTQLGNIFLKESNFTGTNQSLSQNGWQKLPGGLIIQWGVAMVSYGTAFTGTFPIAFPTSCLNIVGTSAPNIPPQNSALIFVQTMAHSTYFATAFNIVSYHINLSTGSNAVYWLAIGY